MRKVNCNGTLFHDDINSLNLSVYLKPNQNAQQICFWLGGKLLERSSVTCDGNTDRELDRYLLKVKLHLPWDLEFSFSIPILESSWHAHKKQTHYFSEKLLTISYLSITNGSTTYKCSSGSQKWACSRNAASPPPGHLLEMHDPSPKLENPPRHTG